MFEQFFERSHALIRQRSAPLADERRRYVRHCIEQGMAKSAVRLIAQSRDADCQGNSAK